MPNNNTNSLLLHICLFIILGATTTKFDNGVVAASLNLKIATPERDQQQQEKWTFASVANLNYDKQMSWQLRKKHENRNANGYFDSDDDFEDSSQHGPPRLWPFGIVPYEISHRLYKYRTEIERAMAHINSHGCVQFVPRHTNPELWSDYLFVDMDDEHRCRSFVGRKGGEQKLLLSSACMNTGTILHELMHTLGFYHEHTRPDRDEYIEMFWENIDPEKWHNFDTISTEQFQNVREFDYSSIMIYGEFAFSYNHRPTMQVKYDEDKQHHFKKLTNPQHKKRLSHLDVFGLRKLYNCDFI